MTNYTIKRFKDESEWLDFRKTGLGGSDAPSVLGLSKWKSPLALWQEKAGIVEPADLSDNEPAYWGKQLEDIVADEFAKRHPELKVRKMNGCYVSKQYPFMFATVDRIITDEQGRKGVLEIKTTSAFCKSDWVDGVPMYYRAQPLHYLAVTGFDFIYTACLIGGQQYDDYSVDFKQDEIDFLIKKETEFWDKVQRKEMPALTGMKDEASALAAQFGCDEDEFVTDFDGFDNYDHIYHIKRLKAQMKELELECKMHENEVKLSIADKKGLIVNGYMATWLRGEKKYFNKKKLEQEMPDIVDKFTELKTSDMGLRIKDIDTRGVI